MEGYNINEDGDLLAEILARLDGRSLCAAAGVCRLWLAVSRRDTVWEALCSRHVPSFPCSSKVIAALGGYRRLYCRCVGPIFRRLSAESAAATAENQGAHSMAAAAARLSLSLFSVDCYERLSAGAGRPSSLLFLGSPVEC